MTTQKTINADILKEYRRLRRYTANKARESLIYPEHKGKHAAIALAKAKQNVSAGSNSNKCCNGRIWGKGDINGKSFSAYGENSVRWIEKPEQGLRLVGLAHNVGKAGHRYMNDAVEHSGWFLDDFQHETVSGVVYQLPGKDGKARYLVGYADPWNTTKKGSGPALLSMKVIEGETIHCSYDDDAALRDAARCADGIAERMAEIERNYQRAYHKGSQARELAIESHEQACNWLSEIRAFRDMWKARKELAPGTIRNQIKNIRQACDTFVNARSKFHSYRDEHKPGKPLPHYSQEYSRECLSLISAWNEGYASL